MEWLGEEKVNQRLEMAALVLCALTSVQEAAC